jgi:predicted N-acyltransferase
MRARILSSIEAIPAAQWNGLDLRGRPFLRHEFLQALEQCGCVGHGAGWTPSHLVLEDDEQRLAGAVPLYEKAHSWGEFVFDWSWAKAYAQAGLRYYPKLVSMAPFTPACGPHLLTAAHTDAPKTRHALALAILEHARAHHLSSAHVLFTTDEDRAALGDSQFMWRNDCQFHWRNRSYADFDHFMASFRAEKRKKALRERRRVQEAGITFMTLAGNELSPALWDVVFGFAAATFESRGHEHYLTADFFRTLAAKMPSSIMVKVAVMRGTPVAAAIFFQGDDTLYGRYWGAAADFHSLHFETCYYQGIDYCIEQGLSCFEPGTQGEHKVARGFEPTETWSAHWIADPRFRRAIGNYLEQERAAIDEYIETVREHTPFRRDQNG